VRDLGFSFVKQKSPLWEIFLFGFFVHGVLLAVLAELLELKTLFQRFLVLSAVIVDAFAFGALKFDEVILRHIFRLTAKA